MRHVALFLVAAALVVSATACGQSGESDGSKPFQPFRPSAKANGRIAFSQHGDEYGPLFVLRPDGSGVRRVTRRGTDAEGYTMEDGYPAWSPDGKKIAFLRGRHLTEDRTDVYVLRAAGGSPKRLTRGLVVLNYAWSPDGKSIAYAAKHADGSDSTHIYVMNADGSGRKALTRGIAGKPAWSPDGARIAFVGVPPSLDEANVYVMSADGSDQRQLTHKTLATSLAWSPDGRRIAFQDPDGIAVVDEAGGDLHRLTAKAESGGDYAGPYWSPDATRIAFVGKGTRVYVMSADGSGQRPITKSMNFLDGLTWSPDGKKLAYVAVRLFPFENDIHVVNADGSGDRRLRNDIDETGLSWQPLPPG